MSLIHRLKVATAVAPFIPRMPGVMFGTIMLAAGVLIASVIAGCGGGGGSTPASGLPVSTQAAQDSILAARAITSLNGLGAIVAPGAGGSRQVVRHRPTLSYLVSAVFAQRQGSRDVSTGFDSGTGLYYRITTNGNGSVTEAFYQDSGMTIGRGSISTSPISWAGGIPGNLPATMTIQLSQLAGISGSETITLKTEDSNGNPVQTHVGMNLSAGGGSISANLNTDSNSSTPIVGSVSVTQAGQTINLTSLAVSTSGETTGTLAAGSGIHGPFDFALDGSGTMTLLDATGNSLLSVQYDSSGGAVITCSDGTTRSVSDISTVDVSTISC